jgi:hypothetical protein
MIAGVLAGASGMAHAERGLGMQLTVSDEPLNGWPAVLGGIHHLLPINGSRFHLRSAIEVGVGNERGDHHEDLLDEVDFWVVRAGGRLAYLIGRPAFFVYPFAGLSLHMAERFECRPRPAAEAGEEPCGSDGAGFDAGLGLLWRRAALDLGLSSRTGFELSLGYRF